MTKPSKPVVFFGSGPVAAKALELLFENFDIEAVITKSRASHHHGDMPVLAVAEKLKLVTFTVDSKIELENLLEDKKFTSRAGVLIDFGIMVSQKSLNSFRLGIVNSHFSILPEWRGADPITFAILSGQQITGVSLMLLVKAMDEGPLLAYGEFKLPEDITTPQLTDELIKLSDGLLNQILPDYMTGQIQPAPQSLTGRQVSYSRKLTKADGLIDWTKPAKVLEREVRAFAGWPKSQAKIGGRDIIILKAKVRQESIEPGKIVLDKESLIVGCSQNTLEILELQPADKRPMLAKEFINGYAQKLNLI